MVVLVYLIVLIHLTMYVRTEIRGSADINKLIKVKPMGAYVAKSFEPITEKPHQVPHSGRRHMEDCTHNPNIYKGAKLQLFGDDYDDKFAKTMAAIPDHIDHKHFEVTTQVPYLTVGRIEAIGYHPAPIRSDHPGECEKIYHDHLAGQYTDETTNYSDESLEIARMPLHPPKRPQELLEDRVANIYDNLYL